jgi:hypothetical protein
MNERPRRGFASMDQERQRQIASKGGKAAHIKGRAHEFTRLARIASTWRRLVARADNRSAVTEPTWRRSAEKEAIVAKPKGTTIRRTIRAMIRRARRPTSPRARPIRTIRQTITPRTKGSESGLGRRTMTFGVLAGSW